MTFNVSTIMPVSAPDLDHSRYRWWNLWRFRRTSMHFPQVSKINGARVSRIRKGRRDLESYEVKGLLEDDARVRKGLIRWNNNPRRVPKSTYNGWVRLTDWRENLWRCCFSVCEKNELIARERGTINREEWRAGEDTNNRKRRFAVLFVTKKNASTASCDLWKFLYHLTATWKRDILRCTT